MEDGQQTAVGTERQQTHEGINPRRCRGEKAVGMFNFYALFRTALSKFVSVLRKQLSVMHFTPLSLYFVFSV